MTTRATFDVPLPVRGASLAAWVSEAAREIRGARRAAHVLAVPGLALVKVKIGAEAPARPLAVLGHAVAALLTHLGAVRDAEDLDELTLCRSPAVPPGRMAISMRAVGGRRRPLVPTPAVAQALAQSEARGANKGPSWEPKRLVRRSAPQTKPGESLG